MKLWNGKLFIFLLLTFFLDSAAQQTDSTLLFSSTNNEEIFSQKKLIRDTSLDNTHNYYQTGVLGNMGLPSYSLLATENNSSSTFFKWMKLNNNNDLFSHNDPVYFRPSGKVYTKITAAMGQKQEQFFKIMHSQNIKRVNVSLLFNRYSCFGFYTFQKTLTDNFLLSSHYTSKNNRWGYSSYLMYNKLKYQLNGGIRADSILEQNPLVDKQLFPVNLSTAKQNVKISSFLFSTFFRLNKKDSTNISHFLAYEGNYQSNYLFYSEGIGDTTYYKQTNFYSTSGINTDSTAVTNLSNSFLYKLNFAADKVQFYAGYKNEWSHYRQFTIDTVSLNHIVRGGFNLNLKDQSFISHAQYVLAGYNADNYRIDANYRLKFLKNFLFEAKASSERAMPVFNSQRIFVTHFTWDNRFFTNISTHNLSFSVSNSKYKFSAGAFAQQQNNQVYYDTLALPQQYNGSTLITRLFIQKDLRLWHMHFNNTINYQTTQNTDIIRLPSLLTFSQLYYENKFFKNNLWLQFGAQARYVSAYMANAYMPETNQFYLQDKKNYGDYVFIDVFFNAQIDRFRFFLLASHINQGLTGGNYMLCPTYPLPDRSFKVGLTWLFFD